MLLCPDSIFRQNKAVGHTFMYERQIKVLLKIEIDFSELSLCHSKRMGEINPKLGLFKSNM